MRKEYTVRCKSVVENCSKINCKPLQYETGLIEIQSTYMKMHFLVNNIENLIKFALDYASNLRDSFNNNK